MAITPDEASAGLSEKVADLVARYEAAFDKELADRYRGHGSILLTISACPKIPERIRDKVEAVLIKKYGVAGWTLEKKLGGQRDPGPWWEIRARC